MQEQATGGFMKNSHGARRARRIVWAVDPFGVEYSIVRQTGRVVHAIAEQWGAQVQPLFLLGGFPSNVRRLPSLTRDIQTRAQRLVARVIPGMLPLRVLEASDTRVRAGAELLSEYALESGSSLIAVGTRARKGLKRWYLGSFAETLILKSEVPLLVVNPNEQRRGKGGDRVEHILFPSDFSPESEAAYLKAVEFAREIGARITLFHKVRFELSPALEAAFRAYDSYRGLFREEVEGHQSKAEEWVEIAHREGVEAESVIDYRLGGSVMESVLRESKRRGGMIAIAARSGPVGSVLLGSVTRQLVRNAMVPVWVVHEEYRGLKGRIRRRA